MWEERLRKGLTGEAIKVIFTVSARPGISLACKKRARLFPSPPLLALSRAGKKWGENFDVVVSMDGNVQRELQQSPSAKVDGEKW